MLSLVEHDKSLLTSWPDEVAGFSFTSSINLFLNGSAITDDCNIEC